MRDTWRGKDWMECSAPTSHQHLPVTLFTSYDGGGFYWPGVVCLQCRAIVAGASPEFGVPGSGDGEPTAT